MTEEVKIKLTSELDSKGYDELRKQLNASRNELNALARATDKGSKEYKTYKESVKEINRIIKLSDADLKKYTQSIIAEEQALKKAEKGLREVGSETEKTSDKLDNLIKVGIAGGITYLVSQVGNLVRSFGELAAEGAAFQNLYSAFAKLNGGIEGANQKLELLRKATSNNLDDQALIEYTNEMNSLGFATEDTAKLLDIADTRGDDLGKTFEQSQTALKDFILSGRELGLKEIGINFVDVRKKIEEMTGATYEQVQSLEDSDQQRIRSMAVLELYGQSTDEINKKLLGTDDKLQNIKTLTQNVSLLFGVTLANAFETAAGETDLFNQNLATTIQDAQKLGKQFGEAYTAVINFSKGIQTFSNYATPVVGALKLLYSGVKSVTDEALRFLGVVSDTIDLQNQFEYKDFAGSGAEEIARRIAEAKKNIEFKKKIDDAINKSKTGSSNTGGTPKETAKVVELTNAILDAEKSILDLQSKLSITAPGTTLFQKYTNEISDLRRSIALLSADAFDLSVKSTAIDIDTKRRPFTEVGIDPLEKFKAELEAERKANEEQSPFNQALDDAETLQSSISNTMQLFNLGVESGIGAFLNGLSTAVQLIKTLQTVNSILSFIPGFASGGSFPGGSPIMVGEKGTELLFPKNPGYIMNHKDSQRYINQSITSNASPVNVYVNSNIDALKFFKDNFPNYRNYEKGKRIN